VFFVVGWPCLVVPGQAIKQLLKSRWQFGLLTCDHGAKPIANFRADFFVVV
jgi:hypothetical protein